MLNSKQLQEIIKDKFLEIDETLNSEGYKARVPRAEWSVLSSSLIITYKDRENVIPDDKLKKVIDGDEKVDDIEKRLIDEWYQISSYRFSYETWKLEKMIETVGNDDIVKWYQEKIKSLINEKESLSRKELRKKQLAYYYNEEGERLERLYQLLEGEFEEVNLKFGSIDVYVNVKSYDDEIAKESYEKSKGFFEDLINAYDFIKRLYGPIEISRSTGIIYTDEKIFGIGTGISYICGRDIKLEIRINKNGMKNDFRCSIETSELDLDKVQVLERIELFLPNYFLDKDKFSLHGFNENYSMGILYCGNKFTFLGEPQILKEEVLKFLDVVLR